MSISLRIAFAWLISSVSPAMARSDVLALSVELQDADGAPLLSRPLSHQVKLPPGLDRQYQAVYPLIRQKIAASGLPLHDMTPTLDIDEAIYTDYNHVTPKGNEIVARRIAEIVGPELRPR